MDQRSPVGTVVRLAGPEDSDALAKLVSVFGGQLVDGAEVRRRLAPAAGSETVVLAEVDGVPVGYASLRLFQAVTDDTPGAELSDLFVLEAYRGRGLGTELVKRVEAIARDQGAGAVVVITGLDNELAQGFYRKHGFDPSAVFFRKRFRP